MNGKFVLEHVENSLRQEENKPKKYYCKIGTQWRRDSLSKGLDAVKIRAEKNGPLSAAKLAFLLELFREK